MTNYRWVEFLERYESSPDDFIDFIEKELNDKRWGDQNGHICLTMPPIGIFINYNRQSIPPIIDKNFPYEVSVLREQKENPNKSKSYCVFEAEKQWDLIKVNAVDLLDIVKQVVSKYKETRLFL